MNSNIFRINVADLGKGAVVAVIAAVLGWLYNAVNQPGFELNDFVDLDWSRIIDTAVIAVVAYIGKNFGSDSDGKFLGRIG